MSTANSLTVKTHIFRKRLDLLPSPGHPETNRRANQQIHRDQIQPSGAQVGHHRAKFALLQAHEHHQFFARIAPAVLAVALAGGPFAGKNALLSANRDFFVVIECL